MKFPSSRLLRTSFSGLVCPQSPKEEPNAFPSSQHQATLGSSSSSSSSSQLSQLTHFRPWDLMVQGHQVSLSQEGDTRQPPTTLGCPTAPATGIYVSFPSKTGRGRGRTVVTSSGLISQAGGPSLQLQAGPLLPPHTIPLRLQSHTLLLCSQVPGVPLWCWPAPLSLLLIFA